MRQATKSETQKKDEWSESKVKPDSKVKPPRYDKRRKHYKEQDNDLEDSHETKEMSLRSRSAFVKELTELSHVVHKQAMYTRIVPSEDGMTFVEGEPVPTRQTDTATWPVWTKGESLRISDITAADLQHIINAAYEVLDPRYDRDASLRKALDETLWTLDGGKYTSKIDAPTYLILLNGLQNL